MARGALTLLLFLALAAPAQAGGTFVVQDIQVTKAGPVFAGEQLVWATERDEYGGGVDVHLAAPDGTGHRQWQVKARTGVFGFDDMISVAGSAKRLALGLNVYGCYPACKYQYYEQLDSGIYSAAPGEAPAEFSKACGASAFFYQRAHLPAVDVTGEVVAYEPCTNGVVLRDFGTSPPGETTFKGAGSPRVAGDFLATSDGEIAGPGRAAIPRSLVLRRWRDGTELLRLDGVSGAFDVQDDGKLAFAGERDGAPAILRASPADPEPKLVAAAAGQVRTVRVARDRVAWRDDAGAHVHELDGRLVAESPKAAVGDFDGARLAWSTRPCTLLAIVTWDLSGEPPSFPGGPCPVAKPVSTTLRAKYTFSVNRVRIELACPAEPALGCPGTAQLWGRDTRKKPSTFHHPDGRVDLAFAEFQLRPGETRAVDMRYGKHRVCVAGRSGLRPLLRISAGGQIERHRVEVVGLRRAIAACEGRASLAGTPGS